MRFDCLKIEDIIGFEWDEGNINKNEKKHGLRWDIIEEVFFNEPLIIIEDKKHSDAECRCAAFGKSDNGKKVTAVFTKRGNFIRVISARPMSKKERIFYEKY